MGDNLHPHSGGAETRQAYYKGIRPPEEKAANREDREYPYAPAPQPPTTKYATVETQMLEIAATYHKYVNRYIKEDIDLLMTNLLTPKRLLRNLSLENKMRLSGLLQAALITDLIIVHTLGDDTGNLVPSIFTHISRNLLPKPEKTVLETQEDRKQYAVSKFCANIGSQSCSVILLRQELDEIEVKGLHVDGITISIEEVRAHLKKRLVAMKEMLH